MKQLLLLALIPCCTMHAMVEDRTARETAIHKCWNLVKEAKQTYSRVKASFEENSTDDTLVKRSIMQLDEVIAQLTCDYSEADRNQLSKMRVIIALQKRYCTNLQNELKQAVV